MPYEIEIAPAALKQLAKLPPDMRRRIGQAIDDLAESPRPHGAIKLGGAEIAWRIRVGDYRVIYETHDEVLLILVIRIGHRREIYRRR